MTSESDIRRKRFLEYLDAHLSDLPQEERIYLDEETEKLLARGGGVAQDPARFLILLLRMARAAGAGVFRVVPTAQAVRLLVRGEQGFEDRLEMPRLVYQELSATIARLAGLPEKAERPADGEFPIALLQADYDVLASVYPTLFGPSYFVSLRSRADDTPGLDAIGFSTADLTRYVKALHRRAGLVIVAGPKGAGKSSIVYATLKQLRRPSTTIMTAEDPVKKVVPGITQSQVSSLSGFTWAEALKGMLRHQADAIYLSEARDKSTVTDLMKASLAGRLAFTTHAARNALSAIHWLRDLGVENFLIADALTAVVSPRLVRRNCPDCRVEYEPDARLLNLYGMNSESLNFRRGEGCAKCGGSGFRGAKLIYELLTLDDGLRAAIREGAEDDELVKAAESAGFLKFFDSVQVLFFEGEVKFEEFHAVMR